MLVKNHPDMITPAERLLELNRNRHARMVIEARDKELRDNASQLSWATKEGRAEGRAEGRLEGLIEVAKNLLRSGMSAEETARLTGLAVGQVQDIIDGGSQ
ncbi:MAG: hypothetical protein LBS19_12190 [Clostridiales bacterium]|nr:hypothetical protein [Clostridiales bacterium]